MRDKTSSFSIWPLVENKSFVLARADLLEFSAREAGEF